MALPPYCWALPIRIYRTVKPVKSIKPIEVIDAGLTGERWLTEVCEFTQVGKLSKDQLHGIRQRIFKDVGYFEVGAQTFLDTLHLQKQALKITERFLDFPRNCAML